MRLAGLQLIILATCIGGFPQAGPPNPAFEVVSIKASAPQRIGSVELEFRMDAGRLSYRGATVRDMLARAYDLRPAQISGPPWIDEDRFDIGAKIPATAQRDHVPAMLQNMLAERFKIVAHRESKEQPVYGLVIAKGGPKLRKAVGEIAPRSSGPAENWSEGHISGSVRTGQGAPPPPAMHGVNSPLGRMQSHHINLTSFAKELSKRLDRPVVDMTGVSGEYDFDFYGDADIVSELRLYGLKLESQKAAVDTLVVDRGERHPTEN